jgi:hypothetical protein
MEVRMGSFARRVTPSVRSYPSEAEEAILLRRRQKVRPREVGVADDFAEGHIKVEQQLGVVGACLYGQHLPAAETVVFYRLHQLHRYLV